MQSKNDKKPYKLPNIKNSVLSESIKDILKYPNEVYFETIKFETGMENLEDVFDMCRDYESVSVSRKL